MDHEEYLKKKQRYEVDYNLEPFAGLTPEYMEMSEWDFKGLIKIPSFNWFNHWLIAGGLVLICDGKYELVEPRAEDMLFISYVVLVMMHAF